MFTRKEMEIKFWFVSNKSRGKNDEERCKNRHLGSLMH